MSSIGNDYIFRLEGEEDIDILNSEGHLLYAIQLKNMDKTITLSDLLSGTKTSFIKCFLEKYVEAIPVLVSYGEISSSIKQCKQNQYTISGNERNILKKYGITPSGKRHSPKKNALRSCGHSFSRFVVTSFILMRLGMTYGDCHIWCNRHDERLYHTIESCRPALGTRGRKDCKNLS